MANKILIDHSTYHSAQVAISGDVVDADLLYDLSNFLECLLIADEIVLPPTDAYDLNEWKPPWLTGVPLTQIPLGDLTEDELVRLFAPIIDTSIRDLDVIERLAGQQIEPWMRTKSCRILEAWQADLARDPQAFVHVYSGAVFLTSKASRRFLRSVATAVEERMPMERHIAQYLLRTNFALGLSEEIPYHPHSARAQFVVRKVAKLSSDPATHLMRHVERETRERVQPARATAELFLHGRFRRLNADMPLVLGACLADAKNPADLIQAALTLRKTPEAKTYRDWSGRVFGALRHGSDEAVCQAVRKLESAERVLSLELDQRYDDPQKVSRNVAQIVSVASDLGEDTVDKSIGRALLSGGLRLSARLAKFVPNALTRRKVVLLLHLDSKRRKLRYLNERLGLVFGRQLSDDELTRLSRLCEAQVAAIERGSKNTGAA